VKNLRSIFRYLKTTVAIGEAAKSESQRQALRCRSLTSTENSHADAELDIGSGGTLGVFGLPTLQLRGKNFSIR
jgi:hypothetical protein